LAIVQAIAPAVPVSAAMFGRLGAIVLAAGFSRRMGPENKLLKPLSGKPLLSHVLARVASLGLGQVLVVSGDSAGIIEPLLPGGMVLVRNENAAEGMGRSIACAAQALPDALDGVFIVLGDMPFVEQSDYRLLADGLETNGEQAICIPIHEGRRGNPVLFGRAHFGVLAQLSGDTGARRLLAGGGAAIIEVGGCSSGILIDLDDPQAFAAAEQRLQSARNGSS
jgi:molybdenum cofactor cytidylyltransferase